MKKRLLIMPIVILAMLVAFSAPAAANYTFDGYELRNMVNGTIQGDVYVGGGHGFPSTDANDNNLEQPYNQTFEVPDEAGSNGENVTWARLYVGIWGTTKYGNGWLNVTFTNNTGNPTILKNITCGNPQGHQDNTPVYDPTNSSYNTGCGVWMVAINCTNNVTSGTNTVNASTATGSWDSRVYGIVLVVVYENSSSAKVQYWVNEGNVDLHYNVSIYGANHPPLNNNVTWFNGTAYNSTEANLTVVYYTGDALEHDYLFMNVPNETGSPGNLSNVSWDNTSYWKYQLDGKDVANSRSDNCSDNYSECCCCSDCNCCCDCDDESDETYYTDGFDFNCFSETNDSTPLKDIVNHTGNNYAIFWRGHDDNGNRKIDSTYNVSGIEGEAYLHPILAVLRLKNITHVYDFSDNLTGTPGEDAWAFKDQLTQAQFNSGSPIYPGTEFDNPGDYDNIAKDDDTRQEDQTSGNGYYAAHRFNFSIDETAPEKINVTWIGKGWHDSETDGAKLYIYNFSATSAPYYDELNSTTSGDPVTLTGGKTSSVSSYIGGGNVTILVNQTSAHTTGLGPEYSHIETDYVKLVITPDP